MNIASLQDDRLFSLSGGIPPEHFDNLNFVSMRRGRRLVAPAPTVDPWGYYAEHRESCHMEADRTVLETSAQPRTESSMEAMDTDEGQRTTARLLQEAHRLSTAAMGPSYATIDESMSATLQGSEAAISNILMTPDPRELHKSEAGEKGPTPVEMKAGLLAGSFSPFDFEKEFQMRHGMNPEDADKLWHEHYQPREVSTRSRTPDEEIRSVSTEDSRSASLTGDLETLRTLGVARNQEFTERGMYAENILAFDARLLQDIISGRWSRQQMYGSTPGWYQDSFYEISPPWEGQYGGYHTPFGNSRLLSTCTSRPRILPLGPASDVTSMAGPPSTVRPSASEIGTTIPAKKVDFSITHDTGETSSTSLQSNVPRKDVSPARLEDKPIGDLEGRTTECASQQRETFHTDERRQIPNVMSLEIRDMDITTLDHDVYYGIYPDFQLPLPDRPQISNLFAGNTHLVSNTNSPMSILRIPSLKKMYGTTDFAIDRSTGQLYKIGDLDVTTINLFGGIPDEDLHEEATESTRTLLKTPQAMSTPITDVPRNVPTELITKDSIPLSTPVISTTSQEERKSRSSPDVTDDTPSAAPIFNLNRVNVQVASSVSSLDEGEDIVNDDEYEKAIRRLEKINKKMTTLVKNWNEESKLAKNSNDIAEIEEFYRPYMDQYNNR